MKPKKKQNEQNAQQGQKDKSVLQHAIDGSKKLDERTIRALKDYINEETKSK